MKIKKRQLVQLIREIVQQTLNEVQVGEWWIYPGGDAQFADGDIGDSNHEGHVIEHISREILEHFTGYSSDEIGVLSNWEDDIFNVLNKAGRLTEEEIDEWENRGSGGGPVDIIVKKLLEDKVFSSPEQAEEAVFIAYGSSRLDARDYAMKHLGWKRMTTTGGWGTELQTWFLRQSDLDDMARGIFNAWDDNGEDEEENANHKVSVEVRSNNKVFSDIPLNVFDRASVSDIVTYKREAAWMRESEYAQYTDIGHKNSKNDFLWVYKDGIFKTVRATKFVTHDHWERYNPSIIRADFQGRYDASKKIISLVDMGNFRSGIEKTSLADAPKDLIQRLKFQFGDDARISTFYEEQKSSPIIDPVNFTQFG